MALSVQPLANPLQIQPGYYPEGYADPGPPPDSGGGGGGGYYADPGGGGGGGGYAGGGGGGGGGGYAAPAPPPIDYAALKQYDQSIGNTQAALNRQDGLLTSGYSENDASYQNALNQLTSGKNQAEGTYNNDTLTTKQGYVGSKNTIRSNAGNSLNGLLRLLGSKGAGGGSAYRVTAPGAVARQATIQQSDVGNTFGANIRNLDTNWNNYMTGYKNQLSSIWSQKDQQNDAVWRQIQNNKAGLLQNLAGLSAQRAAVAGGDPTATSQPLLNQANTFLDSASKYTVKPITWDTQAYNAPSLDKYTVNPNSAPTYNGQAPANDYTSPYLAALLGKKEQALA